MRHTGVEMTMVDWQVMGIRGKYGKWLRAHKLSAQRSALGNLQPVWEWLIIDKRPRYLLEIQ